MPYTVDRLSPELGFGRVIRGLTMARIAGDYALGRKLAPEMAAA